MDRTGSRPSRRQFVQGVRVVGLGLLAGCGRLPGQTQAPVKVPRVGVVSGLPGLLRTVEPFRQGLRELGHVEGQSIALEVRDAEGRTERFPELAVELLHLPLDLLVVSGNDAARAAKQANATIPLVCPTLGDPVGTGLVASLARPGGNLTGLSIGVGADLYGKRLDLLKQAVPGASRVAVLWYPDYPPSVEYFRESQRVAPALGLDLLSLEVRSADEFEGAFQAARAAPAEALVTLGSPFIDTHVAWLVELIARSRLPAMHARREWAEGGGLMAYGPNLADLWRRAATYVDKILKGAKPADLPVEQPREFELVINLKTAQALGLTIPQHVLLQATEVIQ